MVLKLSGDAPQGPWYVKFLYTVLTTSGPLALIAVVLVAFLMVIQWSSVSAIQSGMTTANIRMTAFSESQKTREENVAKLLEKLVQLSRQQCIMTAGQNELARQGCYAAERVER